MKKAKKKNKALRIVLSCFLAAALSVGTYIGNSYAMEYENQINSLLCPAIIDQAALDVSSANGQKLSKRIMEEGATLLRNENDTLPLSKSTKKVNVFGWRSIDWIYGSEGQNASGGVRPENGKISENVDLYKALKNAGVAYNESLKQVYHKFRAPDLQSEDLRGTHISTLMPLCEPNINDKTYYTDEVLEGAKSYSDTAIVVIGRMAGEGAECRRNQEKRGPTGVTDNSRHYLEISTEEEALLTYVGANFENVIVLLNVSNPFECGFMETIPGLDSLVYLGFTGTRGVDALPSLLWGDVSFSGHTVDTFAYDFDTNPANVWYSNSYTNWSMSYEDRVEGIYVGYKWYETADVEGIWTDYTRSSLDGEKTGYDAVVQYPFGYGLSYNDYEWTISEVSVEPGSTVTDDTKIDITVSVKNNGSVPGRDVVAAYVTLPYYEGGIEKASVQLIAYTKTEVIDPGATQDVTVSVDAYDFRSYDCYDKNENGFKGYEIEAGEYQIKLMTDSHTMKTVSYNGAEQEAKFAYNVASTIQLPEDKDTGAAVGNLFTGEDTIDRAPIDGNSKDGTFVADVPWFTRTSFMKPTEFKNESRAASDEAIAAGGGKFGVDEANAWDNATVDAFGDPVNNDPVTWGKNNGLKVAENGVINELGEKLGADYDDPQWDAVLEQLTIDQIISQLINQYYGTRALDAVGKPALTDLDGPAQIAGFTGREKAGTGYPTMVVIASCWNPKLAYEFGKSYGDDMKALGIYGVWGWAIDLHRSAWFGRNHESPSEDTILCGTTVSQACKGLNTRGRYAFIKHFALYSHGGNNKWMSEQTLREIYLEPFRMAFVDGGALGAMTTYQGIGGEHTETSTALLTGVLRKEWNFKGAITTDYIGTREWCDSILRSGGDLGMGVSLGSLAGINYNTSSTNRVQNMLKDVAHHVLYMWLHADYYEKQYQLNPDTAETVISSTAIESWNWWKPALSCLTTGVYTFSALFVALAFIDLMKDTDKTAKAAAKEAKKEKKAAKAELKAEMKELKADKKAMKAEKKAEKKAKKGGK